MAFKLQSNYTPKGDQPQAIEKLVKGVDKGEKHQVLLGVTGSGKTFTVANVIQSLNRPVLVLSHNKTLVSQLYGEFKQFFPDNAVEYFVSYYDYYQPEAFIESSGTYIEKEVSINDEIEKLRLKTTSSLLSGRRDVIVVASISCIYGLGNPEEFKKGVIRLVKGEFIDREELLLALVEAFYVRVDHVLNPGTFRVTGDTVDVSLPYLNYAYRIVFFGDEVEELLKIDPETGRSIESLQDLAIYPATIYLPAKDEFERVKKEILKDLESQTHYLISTGQDQEAKRLEERVLFDLEMMEEVGYCSGIENYSRYFDDRSEGERPFCLLDYFPDDFLLVVDESHVSVPQIRGMYNGDRRRKMVLVDNGFRLPAALDNRPLNFEEFESMYQSSIYVSATPGDYELEQTEGVVVEQIVRPTALLDPVIDIRPTKHQIDDLIGEINARIESGERILVTTLTKRMAEELTDYFLRLDIRTRYIHSEVHTLERVEILRDLRLGEFDVLVGINLLREGLDLPEVSLVAILDADKEGFLRSTTSLTQVVGRAARHINGRAIMYADRITKSMQETIDETARRRAKQLAYNKKHSIEPKSISKSREEIMGQTSVLNVRLDTDSPKSESILHDEVADYDDARTISLKIKALKSQMKEAAKALEFVEAARLRDEMYALEKRLDQKKGKP